MCILSILKDDKSFTLTHNRDEDAKRHTSETLRTLKIHHTVATFPVDIPTGGTWILTSPEWTSAMLNGAFNSYKRELPYRHSRGLFPLFLLEYDNAQNYYNAIDVNNIEPFTQIIIHHKTKEFYVFSWDGKQKVLKTIDESLFVISSSTLYNQIEKKRHKDVIQSIESPNADELALIHKKLFWEHKSGFPLLKTTSQTQIISDYKNKRMKFTKFVEN